LCDVGALAISPSVYTKLPFDPSKDLRGVTMLAYSPHLLVVHPSVQANNLKELVALSKKSDLNFAVTATGSAPHLAGVAVERASGARWQYVPYKGGVQAVQDTVAGQTQVLMNGMLATLPFVQSGKLKVLGVSKGTRMPLIGDVPTIAEQGVPGYALTNWFGLVVPAATPKDLVGRIHGDFTKVLLQAETREKISGMGADAIGNAPEDFAKFWRAESEKWARIVRDANIRAN